MDISAAELSRLGLTAQALAQQVAASDAKVAAGQYRSDGREFLLEVDSALDSLEQIRTIPIQVGGSGQVAQLGDIATVTKGIQDPGDGPWPTSMATPPLCYPPRWSRPSG